MPALAEVLDARRSAFGLDAAIAGRAGPPLPPMVVAGPRR